MKTKLACILVSIILSLCLALPVFAKEAGLLQGAFSFDDKEFGAAEDISAVLTIENNSEEDVKNIRAIIINPEGFEGVSGTFAPDIFDLSPGESKEVSFKIKKYVLPEETTEQTETAPLTQQPPQSVETPSVDTENRGKNSFLCLYITIGVVVIVGVLIFLAIKFKWYTLFSSMLLCVLIVGAIGHAAQVSAAVLRDSLTVTDEITVDGESVVIKAVISYEREVESPLPEKPPALEKPTIPEPPAVPEEPDEPDMSAHYTVKDGVWYVHSIEGLYAWNRAAQKDLTIGLVLTKDITLPLVDEKGDPITVTNGIPSGSNWIPIGHATKSSYKGTIDGNGKTVTNMCIKSSPDYYVGFIRSMAGEGTIRNLTLKDSYIYGEGSFIGAVAGRSESGIENCHRTGGNIIAKEGQAGGIIGAISFPEEEVKMIRNCSNSGSIYVENSLNKGTTAGWAYGGGIVSSITYGQIEGCSNSGYISVTGERAYAGGIAGDSSANTVINCTNSGEIYGSSICITDVGGIVGETFSADITECENHGDVVGESSDNCSIGGITGKAFGSNITACLNIGSVSSKDDTFKTKAGGILGQDSMFEGQTIITKITACINRGNVSGYVVGGITGSLFSADISCCVNAQANFLGNYTARAISGEYSSHSDFEGIIRGCAFQNIGLSAADEYADSRDLFIVDEKEVSWQDAANGMNDILESEGCIYRWEIKPGETYPTIAKS